MSPLLVDADNAIKRHILHAAVSDLKAGEIWTGGVYGTLTSMAAFLRTVEARDIGPIYAFFDAGVPAVRRTLLPGYKGKRRKKSNSFTDEQREKMMSQMATTREALESLGVVCLAYKDREADDCVAAAARVLVGQGATPVVYSTDKDLLQIVSSYVTVYDPLNKRWTTAANFEEQRHVPRAAWLVYRTLMGDVSDCITGSPGCGDKRVPEMIDLLDVWMGVQYDGLRLRECTSVLKPADLLDELRQAVLWQQAEAKSAHEKFPAWKQAFLDNYPRLAKVIRGIDLADSFGGTASLTQAITRPVPKVDQRRFLGICSRLQFASMLGAPDRTIGPFRRAQQQQALPA